MLTKPPQIIDLAYIVRSKGTKGDVHEVIAREDSALFFVLHGKVKFVAEDTEMIADSRHPLYIPTGSCHKNICIEDADLLFFNFSEQSPSALTRISPVEENVLMGIYNEIVMLRDLPAPQNAALILSFLYRLAGLCMKKNVSENSSLLTPALEYISLYFGDPALNSELLAEKCHISKIYLHKLFVEEIGMPPFQYITRVRMERARLLLLNKCSVGQVAKQVGYGDIYAFSRAFKRYFHVTPTQMASLPVVYLGKSD